MNFLFTYIFSLNFILLVNSQNHSINLKYYIPPKNIVLKYSIGDLNNDGINDLVILSKENQKNKYLDCLKYGLYTSDINTKFLSIYLYSCKQSKYILYKILKNIIPVYSGYLYEELITNISIENNKLNLNYFFGNNYYSWFTKEKTYTFEFLFDDFYLVKIKDFYQHRIHNYYTRIELDLKNHKKLIVKKIPPNINPVKILLDLDSNYKFIKIMKIKPFKILIDDSYY